MTRITANMLQSLRIVSPAQDVEVNTLLNKPEKGTPCIEVKSSLLLLLLLWRSTRLKDFTLLVPCCKHNKRKQKELRFSACARELDEHRM